MSSVGNHVAVTPEEHVKRSSRSAVYAWWGPWSNTQACQAKGCRASLEQVQAACHVKCCSTLCQAATDRNKASCCFPEGEQELAQLPGATSHPSPAAKVRHGNGVFAVRTDLLVGMLLAEGAGQQLSPTTAPPRPSSSSRRSSSVQSPQLRPSILMATGIFAPVCHSCW